MWKIKKKIIFRFCKKHMHIMIKIPVKFRKNRYIGLQNFI